MLDEFQKEQEAKQKASHRSVVIVWLIMTLIFLFWLYRQIIGGID